MTAGEMWPDDRVGEILDQRDATTARAERAEAEVTRLRALADDPTTNPYWRLRSERAEEARDVAQAGRNIFVERARQAEATIQRVREIHVRGADNLAERLGLAFPDMCKADGETWPCPTIAALDSTDRHPDPSVSHPDLVAGLTECIEQWMTLNTGTWLEEPEELAARVLVWLAEREWCECPAFPGIVRERDQLYEQLGAAMVERVKYGEGYRTERVRAERLDAFLKHLRADILDEADWIENNFEMISAAWVAMHMQHLARFGHRGPREGERPHIHDGDAAILNATKPAGAPTVAAGEVPKRCTFYQHGGCVGSCVGRYCYANDGNLWTAADEGEVISSQPKGVHPDYTRSDSGLPVDGEKP